MQASNFFVKLFIYHLCWNFNEMMAAKEKVEASFERFEYSKVTKNSLWDFKNVKIFKKRGDMKLGGSIEMLHDVNENNEIQIDIYAFQGNEYRKTPFKVRRQKACDYIATDMLVFPDIVKHSDFPPKCPVVKGSYKIDWRPDFENLPPNFKGRFLAIAYSFTYGQESDNASFYYEIQRYPVY